MLDERPECISSTLLFHLCSEEINQIELAKKSNVQSTPNFLVIIPIKWCTTLPILLLKNVFILQVRLAPMVLICHLWCLRIVL